MAREKSLQVTAPGPVVRGALPTGHEDGEPAQASERQPVVALPQGEGRRTVDAGGCELRKRLERLGDEQDHRRRRALALSVQRDGGKYPQV